MRENLGTEVASAPLASGVSVAMATYNGAKHIREQLDSLARQTVLPLELVVTDDGSTDDTIEIVKDFAGVAPFPVSVFRNETRLGYGDNFLKAASLCRGDLIAFCDQDDIWMGDKIRVCRAFFADPEVMLTIHSARTLNSSGERGFRIPDVSRTRTLEFGKCDPFAIYQGFAMLVRKEVLTIIDPERRPSHLRSHDLWVWFLAASSGSIATISDELALYRQHETNVFGVRQRAGIGSQTRDIFETLNYDKKADLELACSDILMNAAQQEPDRADRLKIAARKLRARSELHRLRTRIYTPGSALFGRAAIFSRILLRGGYWPDASAMRLGPRALAKDLLFGIPGIYKASALDHSTPTE